ncbi:hypothetical protein D3C87_1379470 [compost metagenome]
MFDGKKADEIHGIIGGRIPFGETVRLDAAEPALQPVCGQHRLLPAGAPGSAEDGVRQIVSREQLASMEAQNVVFAPEPHDVVAGFVHPVSIGENRRVDPLKHLRGKPVTIGAHQPEKWHQHEIGAILAPVDGPQRCVDDAGNRLHVTAAGSDHGQRAADAPCTKASAEGQCRFLSLGNIGGGRLWRHVAHEGCVDDARYRSGT